MGRNNSWGASSETGHFGGFRLIAFLSIFNVLLGPLGMPQVASAALAVTAL
jgi:hypothetical protein